MVRRNLVRSVAGSVLAAGLAACSGVGDVVVKNGEPHGGSAGSANGDLAGESSQGAEESGGTRQTATGGTPSAGASNGGSAGLFGGILGADAGAAGEAGMGGAAGAPSEVCSPNVARCDGDSVVTCLADGSGYAAPVACAAGCAGSKCVSPPSCKGLADTCGPSAQAACCASWVVPGGTFDRSNDASSPATVSDFRLDTYEVTVGRFRKFVAAYAPDMIAAGAGKNPNNASDPGWNAAWNAQMASSGTALTAALGCSGSTWTAAPGANENLPADCMNWYEANAFCIWDGGRLPTQTEWNYAAAGGAEQRQYPWSSPAGSVAIDCSYANYMGVANGTDYCVSPGTGAPNRVGSESPKGDGKWGQADLAGNIDEWNIDWLGTYQKPCTDCSNFTQGIGRVLSGSAFNHPGSALLTSYKAGNHTPDARSANFGVRCARRP